jgi:hypothetical protein
VVVGEPRPRYCGIIVNEVSVFAASLVTTVISDVEILEQAGNMTRSSEQVWACLRLPAARAER